MALSVSIHIHFPPTWLFHGISIKLGAHRPRMWGSSKNTSTFSHLSSGMCGCTSDCCGYDRVQARHWEEGYIACLLVTYGTVGWVGGACNIYDPWSFVDIVPHLKNNTQGLNQVYVQTISLHLQSSSFVGTFLWLPFQHLQTARGKKKKKANTRQPVKAAHSDHCQSEEKNCSLSGLSLASPNAQLYYLSIHQVHSNHHTMKKTDRTQAIDNMAGSCLSLLLGYSCSRPSLPFFFCHCVATNTPFWQWSNCAETLERAWLVIAMVVYTLLGVIRRVRFSEPINHEEPFQLSDQYGRQLMPEWGGRLSLDEWSCFIEISTT